MEKAGTLILVKEKNIEAAAKSKDRIPVRFSRAEKLLWRFRDVKLKEERIDSKYVGKSGGLRFKLSQISVSQNWTLRRTSCQHRQPPDGGHRASLYY